MLDHSAVGPEQVDFSLDPGCGWLELCSGGMGYLRVEMKVREQFGGSTLGSMLAEKGDCRSHWLIKAISC